MATDWTIRAAKRIGDIFFNMSTPSIEESIARIISANCPFKPDVAYIPVPRCETCKNFIVERMPSEIYRVGSCKVLAIGYITPDFGCVRWEAK